MKVPDSPGGGQHIMLHTAQHGPDSPGGGCQTVNSVLTIYGPPGMSTADLESMGIMSLIDRRKHEGRS